MPRLMSVALTTDQVIARTKTVTRRRSWANLKPGSRLTLCAKVRGRKPGEPLRRLADVEIVAVSFERLDTITPDEIAREGFPGMPPAEFVRRFFTEPQGIQPDDVVTRIEWRYLDTEEI